MKDEGVVEGSFFPEGVEFLKSIQKTPSFTRNPFEAVEQGVRTLKKAYLTDAGKRTLLSNNGETQTGYHRK